MSTKNSKLENAIPVEIRSLVLQRNKLPHEDHKSYDNLLSALIKFFKPKNVLQWLDVKKLQDLLWEQMFMSRIRPEISLSMQRTALYSMLESMPPYVRSAIDPKSKFPLTQELAAAWFHDEDTKKSIDDLFRTFNYSQSTIDAQAFLLRIETLAKFDKMQESNEARQYIVRRQLEEALIAKPQYNADNDDKAASASARIPNKKSV